MPISKTSVYRLTDLSLLFFRYAENKHRLPSFASGIKYNYLQYANSTMQSKLLLTYVLEG